MVFTSPQSQGGDGSGGGSCLQLANTKQMVARSMRWRPNFFIIVRKVNDLAMPS